MQDFYYPIAHNWLVVYHSMMVFYATSIYLCISHDNIGWSPKFSNFSIAFYSLLPYFHNSNDNLGISGVILRKGSH